MLNAKSITNDHNTTIDSCNAIPPLICRLTLTINKEFLIRSTIYAYQLLYNDNLEVKITSLPTCHFNGLFTKKTYLHGDVVCQYYGDKLRTIEAIRLQDKTYLMRLGEQCYIDAKNYPSIYARQVISIITHY